jgi:hypothetical protein
MLFAQAQTLESLFHNLVRRANANMSEHLAAAETYMRLALRAQSQCRATLEALANIKNPPPVTFVRQANVANGPQQVNNAPRPVNSRSRGESEIRPNELLEQQRNEWLDPGATGAPGGANSQVEAVAALNGTTDPQR